MLLAEFEQLRSAGHVVHGVQTNATLITNEWCELFADYGFRVGVSIDGPAAQNAARVEWRRKPTFERIVRGIALLRGAGIPFSVICVVTPETINNVDVLFRYFEDLGCMSVGFNLEEQEGVNAHRTPLTTEQAERFWLRLWQLREAGSALAIRDLDRLVDWLDTTRAGVAVPLRLFDPIPTVSCTGDVVMLSPELLGIRDSGYGDFVIGNVLQEPIPAMLACSRKVRYVDEFAAGLDACAKQCEYFDFCRGAQAGNRYFEHGNFVSTETAYCRNTRQALVRAAASHLTCESPERR